MGVGRYVSLVVAAAVLSTAGLWGAFPWDGQDSWGRFLFCVAAVAFGCLLRVVDVSLGRLSPTGSKRAVTFEEIGYSACLALLSPVGAVLAALVGNAIEQLITTRTPIKVAYNLATDVVAMAVAAALVAWIGPEGFGPATFAVVLLAIVVHILINAGLFVGLLHQLGGIPGWPLVAEELAVSALSGTVGAGVGFVSAYVFLVEPWMIALLLAPAALGHAYVLARRRALEEVDRERARLDRAIEGLRDGVALVGPDGRLMLANRAFERMVGPAEGGEPIGAVVAELAGEEGPADLTALQRLGRDLDVERRDLHHGERPLGFVLQVRDVTRERQLERLQHDFLSQVSHELRTPLTIVNGVIATLKGRRNQLADNEIERLLASADRKGRELERLVRMLLLRSGIESESSQLSPQPQVLRAEEAIKAAIAEVAFGDVQIDAEPGMSLFADPRHLREMLVNLLSNARLYGRPPVTVTARGRDGVVELRVKDAGGVPSEFVGQLFEPFAQESTGLRRRARGLGIGLTVVRALATANGGDIRYEGGDGATFVLTLPVAPD